MNIDNIPELRIGDLVVEKAVIQGGMGIGVSLSGLASAVASEGGIGVISSVGMGAIRKDIERNSLEESMKGVREEIRKARSLTDGVIGINVMVAVTEFDAILETSIEEGIDIIFMGAGLPMKFSDNVKETLKSGKGPKFGVIVSSDRAVKIIFQNWQKYFNRVPDVVVVEGPLAGGHLGFKPEQISDPAYALDNIFPSVLEAVRAYESFKGCEIPVIAAGGIFSGADIRKYLSMGASGVQMATRFVATDECDASYEFKKSYILSRQEDITIIKSPVGLPGRAIRNSFTEDIAKGLNKPFSCRWRCLKTCDFKNTPYCIAKALIRAREGILAEGFAFAGANAWRVDRIMPVKELFKVLEEEYSNAYAKLAV